jgi:hypothetical protein
MWTSAANPANPPDLDDDSDSMVAESYLSEYHVHRQQKAGLDRNLKPSDFQIKFTAFTDDITKLGTIRKLVHITNGLWATPLECAQEAVNEAGSTEFPFGVRYRGLASANNNDIELVADQHLLALLWQPNPETHIPGSFFLYRISKQVFDLVKKNYYLISESY